MSESSDIELSPAYRVVLEGHDSIETSQNGKAIQLNHYVPVEIDRLKASADETNSISLLGADETPDQHVYSE